MTNPRVSTARAHHMTWSYPFLASCLLNCFSPQGRFMLKKNTWDTMIERASQRHQLVIEALYLI